MKLILTIGGITSCAICQQGLTQSDVERGWVIAATYEKRAVFACLGHFYRIVSRSGKSELKRVEAYRDSLQSLITAARRELGAPLTAPVIDAVYDARTD